MKKYYLLIGIFLLSAAFTITLNANNTIALQFIEQDEYFKTSERADTIVIDVRTPREFKAGHIPNAINIPHRDILQAKQSLEQYQDKNIIFYCHTGVRVGFVIDYLKKNPSLTLDKIYHLRGDYRAWQARGLPIIEP